MKYTYIFLILLTISLNLFSQKEVDSTKQNKFIPDYVMTQFAGNIGFISAGIGYNLFNNIMKAELIYGYVPYKYSNNDIHTLTIKAMFPLFRKEIYGIEISPYLGLTASLELGDNSFLILPDYYSDGYYATNAFHFTFLGGLNFHKELPSAKLINGVDLYCEVLAVDTPFWYFISSKEVKARQVFSIDLGVRFYF